MSALSPHLAHGGSLCSWLSRPLPRPMCLFQVPFPDAWGTGAPLERGGVYFSVPGRGGRAPPRAAGRSCRMTLWRWAGAELATEVPLPLQPLPAASTVLALGEEASLHGCAWGRDRYGPKPPFLVRRPGQGGRWAFLTRNLEHQEYFCGA